MTEKFIFGKKYTKYIIECMRDVTNRLGVGIIGTGKRYLRGTKVGIKENSFVATIESKVLVGSNGKPMAIKMIFANEKEFIEYWTFKKGGSRFAAYPDRTEEVIAEVIEK